MLTVPEKKIGQYLMKLLFSYDNQSFGCLLFMERSVQKQASSSVSAIANLCRR